MPASIFILQRLYVRVDGVMVRVNDTRMYHEVSRAMKAKSVSRE